MNILEKFFGNVSFKSDAEIDLMQDSARIVSDTLAMLADEIKPGIQTITLDRLAETFIRDHKATPAFIGLYGYPNTLCTSINDEIVHGIPGNKELRDGDIISIDCGAIMHQFYSDQAYTFGIGEISDDKKRLLTVTYECLILGIEQMKSYYKVGDISFAIQQHALRNGYQIVEELVGHGIGKKIHEFPQIPNHGQKGSGTILVTGFVLAIEPMLTHGSSKILKLEDGWTIVTRDGLPSAHFEHNVAIRNGKATVLSDFSKIESILTRRGYFKPQDFVSIENSINY
ncbi:MAG: type I methionyl aminopeptidase [Candidatus Kapabacteria bacterium]|nr:type I methionyl aminopeptidase [Candidatus Kapabacteria bacterium]